MEPCLIGGYGGTMEKFAADSADFVLSAVLRGGSLVLDVFRWLVLVLRGIACCDHLLLRAMWEEIGGHRSLMHTSKQSK